MPPGIALFHTGLGGNAGLRFTGRVPTRYRMSIQISSTPCKAQAWQCAVCLAVCWTVDGWLVVGTTDSVPDRPSGLSGLGKGCLVKRLVGRWKDELKQRSQLLDGGGE